MTVPKSVSRWLASGLLALSAGLVTNALLGPLFTGTIRYPYTESLINQGIAVDAVAPFAAAPIAILAAVLILRGHRAGPVLALIPALRRLHGTPICDRA